MSLNFYSNKSEQILRQKSSPKNETTFNDGLKLTLIDDKSINKVSSCCKQRHTYIEWGIGKCLRENENNYSKENNVKLRLIIFTKQSLNLLIKLTLVNGTNENFEKIKQ